MRVVTVRQPFASLIAVGAKTLLDQARPTEYRGRLLIRAASVDPSPKRDSGHTVGHAQWLEGWHWWWAEDDPRPHWCWQNPDGWNLGELPFGVVVASCELVDCVPVVEKFSWLDLQRHGALVSQASGGLLTFHRWGDPSMYRKLDDQLPFGDFAPGRHVWLLDDVRPTTERCPRCWGLGTNPAASTLVEFVMGCDTCLGAGVCPPVWMRGGPGLRTPEWEET